MMGEWDGPHPTDGTIHTWIDGELDAAESARLAAHMGECAECSARVAEARGLVAGASRVVGMLDASPALLVRPEPQPIAQPIANTVASPRGSMWRTLRVTPARAAIAAVLIVAVGIALTRQNVAVDAGVRPSDTTLVALVAPKAAEVPTAAVAPRTAVAPEVAAAPTPSTTSMIWIRLSTCSYAGPFARNWICDRRPCAFWQYDLYRRFAHSPQCGGAHSNGRRERG